MSAGKRSGARRCAAIPTEAWYIRRGEGVMPEPRLGTAALSGKGFCSDVYAWDEGRALKVFHGRVAPDPAARKFAVSRAVHAAGVPSPAVYDLIEVEGRCGIVLERIDGPSLLEHPKARPWSIFAVVRLRYPPGHAVRRHLRVLPS